MAASQLTIDFTNCPEVEVRPSGVDRVYGPPLSAEGKVLTPKQIRARMRRSQKRRKIVTDEELEYLYRKPIDEWDLQELAHGRPKNSKGHFKGPKPQWITVQIHEEAMKRYQAAVKGSMRSTTVDALEVLNSIIQNEEVDEKGKPIVPASTKLEAAKFLLEHAIGKPTQRIEQDLSVKLQGILGTVMVNPSELATGNYMPGHFPGMTMELSTGPSSDDDSDLLPSES